MLHNVVLGIHLCTALAVIGLVLLQHGKGADAGAAFGAGASATVFGARGASSFFSRATGILAAVFFLTSLTLGIFLVQKHEARSITESVMAPTAPAPAVDLPPAIPPASGEAPNPPAAATPSGTPPAPVDAVPSDRAQPAVPAPPPSGEVPPAP